MKHSAWPRRVGVLASGAALLALTSGAASPAPAPVPPPAPAQTAPAPAQTSAAPAGTPTAPESAAPVRSVPQEAPQAAAPLPAQSAGQKPAQTSSKAAADAFPDAAMLQRLARRALMDATGRRMHTGPVELREKLADGSWRVWVTLEDGRRVSGRLYRNRRRWHITVDRRELFAPEQVIQIKQ